MNIFNIGINAIKSVFGTKPSVTAEEAATTESLSLLNVYRNESYLRTTTATRRFHRDASREYSHVSLPITAEDQRMVKLFGLDTWRKVLRVREHGGDTYNVGINAEKRRLNKLPKGGRKRALRIFRTQLRAQGIK